VPAAQSEQTLAPDAAVKVPAHLDAMVECVLVRCPQQCHIRYTVWSFMARWLALLPRAASPRAHAPGPASAQCETSRRPRNVRGLPNPGLYSSQWMWCYVRTCVRRPCVCIAAESHMCSVCMNVAHSHPTGMGRMNRRRLHPAPPRICLSYQLLRANQRVLAFLIAVNRRLTSNARQAQSCALRGVGAGRAGLAGRVP
jgi:hypothetical protein